MHNPRIHVLINVYGVYKKLPGNPGAVTTFFLNANICLAKFMVEGGGLARGYESLRDATNTSIMCQNLGIIL